MRRLWIVLGLVAAMCMLTSNVIAADNNDGKATWNVSVGKDTSSTTVDAMLPKVIYIHEGDSVVFTNGAKGVPHTVTFLGETTKPLTTDDPEFFMPSAPSASSWDGKVLLNSGMLFPDAKYEIEFAASGIYPYYCILHMPMRGTVVVLPKGQKIPSKAEQIATAKAEEDAFLAMARMLEHPSGASYVANKDGSLTYKVSMGSENPLIAHHRMSPDPIVISEGDSVEWKNESSYEPYFVAFNLPEFKTMEEEEAFDWISPTGNSTFDGTGFSNSGFIFGDQPYTLKFTKVGTYQYVSPLQSPIYGATGTVVVLPKGAVKLIVNGKVITDSAKAQWVNGELNVGLAALSKVLGGSSKVDTKAKTASIMVGSKKMAGKAVKGNALTIYVNGSAIPGSGSIVKGTAYGSAEKIVRALGGSYSWNEQTKTFTVTIGTSAGSGHNGH